MRIITTLLELLGIVLIVAGIALLSVPGAFIAAGAGAIVISWRVNRP